MSLILLFAGLFVSPGLAQDVPTNSPPTVDVSAEVQPGDWTAPPPSAPLLREQWELHAAFSGLTAQQFGVGYALQIARSWKFTTTVDVILFQDSGKQQWQLMPRVGIRYSPHRLGTAPVFGISGSLFGAWAGALVSVAASGGDNDSGLYQLGAPVLSPRLEVGVQHRFKRWEVSGGLSADIFFYTAVGNEESPETSLLQPWIRASYRF